MKSHYTPSRELFLTQPNKIQRRKRKTEKQDRDYIRSTHIWLCFYPMRMNYPYAVLSTDQINKNYLKRLGEKVCSVLGENHIPHAFINIHDQDTVIKSDLDKERALISAIKEAYINDSSDLNTLLYKARNHQLISSETVREDACMLSETDFYEKYRFYTEEMLGSKKEPHINVILNYTSAKTKFYLKTVYKADDFSIEQVYNGRKVTAFPFYSHLRHVCGAFLQWCVSSEIALQQVGCNATHIALIGVVVTGLTYAFDSHFFH